ncbi:MAG TPA: helix-turn-helix domain-containing protein, partial [Dehalococcoidia bacterium]
MRGSLSDEAQASIQVVERVAQILDVFSARQTELRTAAVAATLGLRRSTAHRYLTSLAQVGLLQRDGDDATYTLGPRLLQFGAAALGRLPVVEHAGPLMLQLATEAHQTALLSVWAGQGPVIVRVQADPEALMHTTAPLGRVLPLDSAQALAFLAWLPERSVVAALLATLPDGQRQEIEGLLPCVRARS